MQKIWILVFFTLLAFSLPVFAHKVNLFCYLEDNTLYGEGYFSDGKPAKNSKVEIYDEGKDSLVATLFTDSDGRFSLSLNDIEKVKIFLYAGMGHKAEYIIGQGSRETAPASRIDLLNVLGGIAGIAGIFYLLYIARKKNAS